MANIAIFRINYKSDFILTLQSDAGWMTPFCIKFWTGAPSRAYFVGFDGITYTHCAPVDGEPTKLRVQFDDHRLPIGDLKFQISYHFTVADFPTSVEDEVLNQASVIIEVDDVPAQVMLDLNGETAPEIEFSLPAYANEAQRIANEQARIAAEEQRISNEEARIAAEQERQQNEQQRISREQQRIEQEQQRINAEAERVSEFASLKTESEAATDAANIAATLANEKAQLADDKAALAQAAATLANEKAQLAEDKANLAQQKADYAQTQGNYAKAQGDAAKTEAEAAHSLNEEVSHDEATRQQQETARQQAESQRVTDFNTQMQQQQTAYTEAEGARETAFNEAEQQRDAKVDEKVADITNLQAQLGYFVCDTGASVAAKTIAATGYVLTTGGNIRIKMTNANTADSATLNINSTGAKALFYNGTQASSTNSWDAGVVLEVYYDGTQFQCQANKGGGSADDITFSNEKSHLVANDVQNAIDEVVPFTLHTMNDSITVKAGYRLVNYNEIAAAGKYITDFIPVKEGVSYHLVCNGEYGNWVAGAFYRENKTGLQLLGNIIYDNNNDIVVTAPTGAKYIKLTSYTPYINIREIDETIGEKVLNQQYNLITYSLEAGSLNANGEKDNNDGRWQHTNKIQMHKGDKFWVRQTNNQIGSGGGLFLFDTNEEIVDAYPGIMSFPEYFTAPYDGYFRIGMCALNTGLKLSIDIRQLCATTAGKKKYMPKNIHTCGHSFWVNDGATRSQFGVTFTIRGFQTIFKEQYIFDNFDNLPYDGHSLGATSESDASSIALKLSSWTGNTGDIWTLDTVTNDFKRNIPIGTLDDYNNNTGATTYYGALRIFADKIAELSGTSAVVIVANATHRNNAGYTSTSTNTAGHTLTDYSNALSCIAVINGWNFVDAFNYGGIFDDNLAYTLLDGLHPNNLGYSLIAKEWLKVLDMIYNKLLS